MGIHMYAEETILSKMTQAFCEKYPTICNIEKPYFMVILIYIKPSCV